MSKTNHLTWAIPTVVGALALTAMAIVVAWTITARRDAPPEIGKMNWQEFQAFMARKGIHATRNAADDRGNTMLFRLSPEHGARDFADEFIAHDKGSPAAANSAGARYIDVNQKDCLVVGQFVIHAPPEMLTVLRGALLP